MEVVGFLKLGWNCICNLYAFEVGWELFNRIGAKFSNQLGIYIGYLPIYVGTYSKIRLTIQLLILGENVSCCCTKASFKIELKKSFLMKNGSLGSYLVRNFFFQLWNYWLSYNGFDETVLVCFYQSRSDLVMSCKKRADLALDLDGTALAWCKLVRFLYRWS